MPPRENLVVNNKDNRVFMSRNYGSDSVLKTSIFALDAFGTGQGERSSGNEIVERGVLRVRSTDCKSSAL